MFRLAKTDRFEKQLLRLDRTASGRILGWMESRLAATDNPRQWGKALKGVYAGKWRFRVGDYRIICQIRDDELLILALDVGHRRDIYR
jgi:mRNA interferase RelE/StbE